MHYRTKISLKRTTFMHHIFVFIHTIALWSWTWLLLVVRHLPTSRSSCHIGLTLATSRALAPRRYHNLSSTIMVFVCLYGFHKCISCSVCHWQCRSALRSVIAGTCHSRAGIARTIALYRDSWVVASVGQFNRYYCEHALSTHMW